MHAFVSVSSGQPGETVFVASFFILPWSLLKASFVAEKQSKQLLFLHYSHLLTIKNNTVMTGLDCEVVERADMDMEEAAQILSRLSLEERDESRNETKLLAGSLRGRGSIPGIIIHTFGFQTNVC